MFYALYKELVGYSLVRRLTCGVVVHTETDGVDIGISFQHLEQHLIPDTASGGIAVAVPIFLMKRNKGKHIYGSLKQIERVVRSGPVEAVTGIAAFRIAFVGALTACSSFVCVSGNAMFIVANEDGVVVIGGFIDHSLMHKGGKHLPVYSSAIKQICIHSPHIIIFRWKGERLRRLSLDRLGSRKCAAVIAEQKIDGLRKVHVIKSTNEVYGVATDAFILMKPQISSDRNLFRAVTPHIFLAGAFELFPLTLQECNQVCLSGSFPLFGGEMYIFS